MLNIENLITYISSEISKKINMESDDMETNFGSMHTSININGIELSLSYWKYVNGMYFLRANIIDNLVDSTFNNPCLYFRPISKSRILDITDIIPLARYIAYYILPKRQNELLEDFVINEKIKEDLQLLNSEDKQHV